MNIDTSLELVNTIVKGLIGLGMSLVAVALVVDLLVPGTTNIVSNVTDLVNGFVGQGLIGLIALIFFVAIFSRE